MNYYYKNREHCFTGKELFQLFQLFQVSEFSIFGYIVILFNLRYYLNKEIDNIILNDIF